MSDERNEFIQNVNGMDKTLNHDSSADSFELPDLATHSYERFSGFSIGTDLLSAQQKSKLVKVSYSFMNFI